MILSITILSVLVGVLGIVTFLHTKIISDLKSELATLDRVSDLRHDGLLARINLLEEDVEDLIDDVANQGI